MNYSKVTQKTCNNTGITQDVQIFKIIPPFWKEDVSSHKSLSDAYKVCVQEILAQFPDAMAEKITISRTFAETKCLPKPTLLNQLLRLNQLNLSLQSSLMEFQNGKNNLSLGLYTEQKSAAQLLSTKS